MDGLDIPDFLKRPLDPNAKRIITRRRNNERKIPWKGWSGKKALWLPKSMDATAWAILREQEKLAEKKKQERLAQLKLLRSK